MESTKWWRHHKRRRTSAWLSAFRRKWPNKSSRPIYQRTLKLASNLQKTTYLLSNYRRISIKHKGTITHFSASETPTQTLPSSHLTVDSLRRRWFVPWERRKTRTPTRRKKTTMSSLHDALTSHGRSLLVAHLPSLRSLPDQKRTRSPPSMIRSFVRLVTHRYSILS